VDQAQLGELVGDEMLRPLLKGINVTFGFGLVACARFPEESLS
jgi:hypothetical protein